MSDNTAPLENFFDEKRRKQRTAMNPKCRKCVYFLDKKSDFNQNAFDTKHLPSRGNTSVGINEEVYKICACGCNLVFDDKSNTYIKRHVNSEYVEFPKYATGTQTAPQKPRIVCKFEKVRTFDVEVTAHPRDFEWWTDELKEISKRNESVNQNKIQSIKKYDTRRSFEVVEPCNADS